MADLTRKLAAMAYKIVGADRSTGNETAFGYVESRDGEIKAVDILNAGGTQGSLSVTSTATEIRVGASNLANRKSIMIYNNSTNTIYWGVTNAVTVANGIPLPPQSFISLSFSNTVTVWGIAPAALTAEMRIVEVS